MLKMIENGFLYPCYAMSVLFPFNSYQFFLLCILIVNLLIYSVYSRSLAFIFFPSISVLCYRLLKMMENGYLYPSSAMSVIFPCSSYQFFQLNVLTVNLLIYSVISLDFPFISILCTGQNL